MEDSDKTSDSPAKKGPQSKTDCSQAWARLTAKYLHDLPQQLAAIRSILEAKDYAAIKKQAHRIKGTSGTYHLDTISESVAQLERLADSKNSEAIGATINEVMRLVELETNRLNSRAVSSAGISEGSENE